jgi:hypothetical protein
MLPFVVFSELRNSSSIQPTGNCPNFPVSFSSQIDSPEVSWISTPFGPYDSHTAAPGQKLSFYIRRTERRLSAAKNRYCSESVLTLRSKSFAGPLSGLPDGRVRIFIADDGEKPYTEPADKPPFPG